MIACVSGGLSVSEDTISTLQFASRAKSIQNHARVNVQAGSGAESSSLLAQYETQLAELRHQLAAAEKSRSTEVVEVSTSTKQLEHERSAAEAALAQCVREYAKERAQKVSSPDHWYRTSRGIETWNTAVGSAHSTWK